MAREYGRNQRIAGQLQRELAVLIQREAEGELGMITVSAVDVSPDLKNARVYFTALNLSAEQDVLERELNARAGFFRHQLARILPLKLMPTLRFVFDQSIARANHLNALLDSVAGGNASEQ